MVDWKAHLMVDWKAHLMVVHLVVPLVGWKVLLCQEYERDRFMDDKDE